MNRVAFKNVMIPRRTTPVVLAVRCQDIEYWVVQRNKRTFRSHFLTQPQWDRALQAVCVVRLLVKGMAIDFVAFLASHPANPLSRPWSLNQSFPE
jgi:hypothetical protein